MLVGASLIVLALTSQPALAECPDEVSADGSTCTITSSDDLSEGVELEFVNEFSTVIVDNSGSVTQGVTQSDLGLDGASIFMTTALDGTLDVTNSGTISTADKTGSGLFLSLAAGDGDAQISLVNSGLIEATGGSFITGTGSNQIFVDFGAALVADASATGASSVSITNEAGGVISGRGGANLGLADGAPLNTDGLAVAARADTITLVNHGTILGGEGGSLTLADGTVLVPDTDTPADYEGVVGQAIDMFDSSDDITNSATGVIEGGIALRRGHDILGNYGTITGDVWLGRGNDIFVQGSDASFTGTLDGGNGVDTYAESVTASGNFAISSELPTGFEIAGVEVLGTDTVVTVINEVSGEANNGLALYGNGNVVNQAIIDPISLVGAGTISLGSLGLDGESGPLTDAFLATLRSPAVNYGGEFGQREFLTIQTPGTSVRLLYGGALNSFSNEGVINGDLRLNTASFTNSGEINLRSADPGTIIFAAADQDFTFTNTGTVSMTDDGPRQIPLTGSAIALVSPIDSTVLKAVDISNSGDIGGGLSFQGFASDFTLENSGTISMAGNGNGIDRAVEIEIGGLDVALDPVLQEDAVANSVTIINTADGTLDGGIDAEVITRTFAFTNHGLITADANDAYAEAIEIEVDDYALVDGEDDTNDAESASFTNTGTIAGTVGLELEASAVSIDNSGDIARGLTPDATLFAEGFGGLEVELETTLGATLDFVNSGTISTADYAGVAVSIEVEAGDLDSGVAGAETASATVNFVNSGTIAASGGSFVTPLFYFGQPGNQVSIDFAAALAIVTDAEGASSISITNEAGGIITARGAAHLGNPAGAELIAGQGEDTSGLAVAAFADTVTIVNNGTILGGPGGPLTLEDGTVLIPDVDLDIDFDGRIGGAIDTFASTDTVTNGATGVIEGGIALRDGDDTLSNHGSITGDIYFGTGNDTFIQGVNATFTGTAFGGDGEDRFQLDITGGTLNNAVYDQFVSQLDSFEILGVTGSGNIDLSSGEPLPVETIELGGGEPVTFGADSIIETQGETAITGTGENNALVVEGTVNGNVDLGGGDNSFTLGGTVNGDIAFGTGNDALVLQPGGTFTGTATGGDGFDSLSAPLTGTYEEPTILDLAQFESFEELNVTSGGVGAVESDLTFETVNVDDGRLIGLAGSTISGDVNVTEGGTFGSAGTVNGDVNVGGTLSPGSSPGTMTINGDVTLAGGSTTVFEMTEAVSDAIVINGALTIETGTTLEITGERPLTPGVAYDLITTTDGITGTFTTVDKAETVLGFLSYTPTALQLLGTFQLRADANPQIAATNDHLNSLLIAGTATAGISAAIPDLVDADGFASEAAMATLHPEAYASASQIGIENGLAISSALRSANLGVSSEKAGLFAFGQGFGKWRNFKAESGSGASKADVRSTGFLGGIGYGNETVALSVFVGRVDSKQSISAIGATNEADGTFAGANAQFASNNFTVGGSIIWDGSSADTSRNLFDGSTSRSHYRLRGLTFDGYVRYGMDLGASDWQVGPELGITHVRVKRGDAAETGGGAFALNVDGETIKATFLNADLTLTKKGNATLRPWLSAGLRQRLSSDPIRATASFTGVTSSFTVVGAERDKSFANIGAGFNWKVSPSLDLFARGDSEFGSDNNAQSVNAGLRFRF